MSWLGGFGTYWAPFGFEATRSDYGRRIQVASFTPGLTGSPDRLVVPVLPTRYTGHLCTRRPRTSRVFVQETVFEANAAVTLRGASVVFKLKAREESTLRQPEGTMDVDSRLFFLQQVEPWRLIPLPPSS